MTDSVRKKAVFVFIFVYIASQYCYAQLSGFQQVNSFLAIILFYNAHFNPYFELQFYTCVRTLNVKTVTNVKTATNVKNSSLNIKRFRQIWKCVTNVNEWEIIGVTHIHVYV